MLRGFVLAALIATTAVAGAQETEKVSDVQFQTFTLPFRDRDQPCAVYLPQGYDPDKTYPLIMFLHGMGERGSDGVRQTEVGLGRAIKEHPEWFPCIVLMPQCPDDSFWCSIPGEARFDNLGDASPFVDMVLGEAKKRYNIDPSRIVLTGLSMGGYGTFIYGAQRTNVYAAYVPVCGRGLPEDAEKLATRPMRIFHGGKDSVVPVENSKVMYEAIKKAGGDVQLTIFADLDHNSWDATYSDPAVIKWMLAQKLPDTP